MPILTTHIELPDYGDDEITLTVDYDYSARFREMFINGATIQIDGREVDVWHRLSQMQKWSIEERCLNDVTDRSDAVREARYDQGAQR